MASRDARRNVQASLGPFVLGPLVGRGGQGVVYRAAHAEGLVVALKLPTHAAATDRRYVTAFHDEARAFAALDHPAIARIFDFGTVPAEVEHLTGGALRAGLPWLAMEWASGGTLATQARPSSFGDVVAVLEPLLGALAHVHANGLVHRDVKPENVLVCAGGERAPGLRLADFGLVMGASGGAALLGGTPAYMAPEQREGLAHAQGPWTDVFAVGVLAWEWMTGERPPRGEPPGETPFVPRFRVPDGAIGWLLTTLSSSPGERYLDASDALHALRAAGAGASRAVPRRETERAPAAPERAGTPSPLDATVAATTLTAPSPATSIARLSGMRRAALPPLPPAGAPLPPDWREPRPPSSPASPANAGRGVVMLRPPPLVGRDGERDRLWAALADVARTCRPRVIVIEAGAGIGKTRLARWLAVRARELGVATIAEATHHDPAERGDGLVSMLARALRLEDLGGEPLREGIALAAPWLASDERAALARLLSGGPAPERARPRDRVVLASRALSTLARHRPLVLVLDDASLDPEAVALARELLDADAAVLVVLTARDESLVERAPVAEALRALAEDPRGERMVLAPLSSRETGVLVRGLVGLDAPAALAIEERAGGNAAFALELVTVALDHGRLAPGPDGFRLAGALELPGNLADAWRQRVQRALAPFADAERRALLVAAVLGERVDLDEWRAALDALRLAPSSRLVEHLLRARLAQREGSEAWRFAHGTLREAIVGGASDADVRAAHDACVRALEGRSGEGGRLGRHLLRAGRPAEALGPLLAAIDTLDAAGDYPAAASLLADAEQAAARLAAGTHLRGDVSLRRMKATKHLGRLADARALGRTLRDEERREGWSARARAELRLELADLERLSGDAVQAIALLDEAAQLTTDPALAAGRRRRRAQALIDAGRLDEARLELGDVERDPEAAPSERVMARRLEGVVLRLRGEAAAAARVLEAALPAAEGLRWQTAELLNALGDALRASGELDRAERTYAEGLARFQALASGDAPVVELNHGLLLLARGEWARVAAIAQRTASVFARNQRRPLLAAALALGLAPRLAHDERDAFDRDVAEVESLLAATGFVEKDLAFIFEHAATLASARGETERAARLLGLLARQRAQLSPSRP